MTRLKLATGDEVRAQLRFGGHRVRCLLLHGNPGVLEDWAPILPALAELADVAAIDLPGFGYSTSAGDLSLIHLADAAVAVADALSWTEPFFVVGHSHGGGVAQTTAARHPERIAGLGLLATLGSPAHASYRLLGLPGATAFTKLGAALLGRPAARGFARPLLRTVMRDIFWPEPVPEARVESELALISERPEILTSMVRVARGNPCQQLLAAAPAIACPVTFVHGEQDRLVPIRCAQNVHRAIVDAGGRSRLVTFGGAGHMLMAQRGAEVVSELARLFGAGDAH